MKLVSPLSSMIATIGCLLLLLGACSDDSHAPPPDGPSVDSPRSDGPAPPDGPRLEHTTTEGQLPLDAPSLKPDSISVQCLPKDSGGFDCKSNVPCKLDGDCPKYAPVKCPGSWKCIADLCHYLCS